MGNILSSAQLHEDAEACANAQSNLVRLLIFSNEVQIFKKFGSTYFRN